MPLPPTKLSVLKDKMAAGDYRAALRIANGFPQLGDHDKTIRMGWNALQRPEFYRELGHDPDDLFRKAVQAIRDRYDIPEGPRVDQEQPR